jgi:CheY-like chemotaxis protein
MEAVPHEGKRQVLVIDDNLNGLKLLCIILTRAGYAVVPAASAAEGLTKFQEGGFHLVISDRNLPGMQGEELAKVMRASAPTIAFIIISGDSIGGENSANPSAPEVFLPKPFTTMELMDAVKLALDRCA